MLKKASRKSDVVDVPADDPQGTMDRFTAGLRRVLTAEKPPVGPVVKPRKRRRVK